MSQTPSVFSFNTGNDNTSLHPLVPCPDESTPVYFAIHNGNVYVNASLPNEAFGDDVFPFDHIYQILADNNARSISCEIPEEQRVGEHNYVEDFAPIRFVIMALKERPEARKMHDWLNNCLLEVVPYLPGTPPVTVTKGDTEKAREMRHGKRVVMTFMPTDPNTPITDLSSIRRGRKLVHLQHDGNGGVQVTLHYMNEVWGVSKQNFWAQYNKYAVDAPKSSIRVKTATSYDTLNSVDICSMLETLDRIIERSRVRRLRGEHEHAREWLLTAYETLKAGLSDEDAAKLPDLRAGFLSDVESSEDTAAEVVAEDAVEEPEPVVVVKEDVPEEKVEEATAEDAPETPADKLLPAVNKVQQKTAEAFERIIEASRKLHAPIDTEVQSPVEALRQELLEVIDHISSACFAATAQEIPADVHNKLTKLLTNAHLALKDVNSI